VSKRLDLAARLRALDAVGIKVVDHIVVAASGCSSMAEAGILEVLGGLGWE
jgi:DNA repair protein RadC